VRRGVLIAALIALVILDLAIVPLALLLVFIGVALSGVGHTGGLLVYGSLWLVVSGGLIWLTIRVAKAVR
jgi:hypothetical protein